LVALFVPRRRSSLAPPPRVPLSDGERVAAQFLVRHGVRHLRQGAQALLDEGADADELRDLRISITASLGGDAAALARFGATAGTIVAAAKRVRYMRDSALWTLVVHALGDELRPSMSFLGTLGSELRQGCHAWAPSAGVDPSIPVRRWPEPLQEELFEE